MRDRTPERGGRRPTWRGRAVAGRTAAPATRAGAASGSPLRKERLRASEHSGPCGACDAAYLSPLCLFGLPVAGLSVDDRLEHSVRRAAEHARRSRILDRMVRAPGEG